MCACVLAGETNKEMNEWVSNDQTLTDLSMTDSLQLYKLSNFVYKNNNKRRKYNRHIMKKGVAL